MDQTESQEPSGAPNSLPTGPAVAAMIAGGIGTAVLGALTVLAETGLRARDSLTWSTTVGPLSGETILAVGVWLASWALLHLALRGRDVKVRTALGLTLALVLLGVLGVFPAFFHLFAQD
ncbi:MAG: hypothetical protein WDA71_04635 [Actinomycetota bacterium]